MSCKDSNLFDIRKLYSIDFSSAQTASLRIGQCAALIAFLFIDMDLPVYEVMIDTNLDSDIEINFVSLVKRPAIQRNFLAFKEHYKFKVTNEDRRIVTGALMIADLPIYRNEPNIGEFYIVFSKEQVYNAAKKFFSKGYQNNLNLEHNGQRVVKGATMFESFIVDSERGIRPMEGFDDAPDGSWFGSFSINDDGIWQDVKDGKFQGFSIEGILDAKRVEMAQSKTKEELLYNQITDILKQVADK